MSHDTRDIADTLHEQFAFYTTANLRDISVEKFTEKIQSKIGIIDAGAEGYSKKELDRQRDLSLNRSVAGPAHPV